MTKQSLHEHWNLRPTGDLSEVPADLRGVNIPAMVPGCVHTDLMAAGKTPDPYLDLYECELQWIGRADWEYRTTFTADPKLFDHERIDLVFDGLDTIARIELNGQLVADTQNMHRSYRFDVRKLLKRGENELKITFASAVKYAFAMREKLGNRPWTNGAAGPFAFIRKMACNFGWDWGPALVTCGIWKAVRLEGWSGVRIVQVRPIFRHDVGECDLHIDLEWGDHPDHFNDGWQITSNIGAFSDNVQHGQRSVLATGQIESKTLWWSTGHGKPVLHDLVVGINNYESPDQGSDKWSSRIGFRTTELDTTPDDIGRAFTVKVNGKPIFCKGFNWIPDDCFPTRACEPDRVRRRIQQAVDAGANMLRVWGGGIYETDDFYNICDELGVMVWQDFPFACAAYPEEEPFYSEIEAEARENVSRLAHHPSLVLWNGNNENFWGFRDWGWHDNPEVMRTSWGKKYYLELLPKILGELDPARPYWPGSPWSGDHDVEHGLHPNLPTHGNKHEWTVWVKENYPTYRKEIPRFCSEFGFQGPANYSTIARVVPPDQRDFASAMMRHRQKCVSPHDDGDIRNFKHIAEHFDVPGMTELIASLTLSDPKPPQPAPGNVVSLHAGREQSRANFNDLHYLAQLNQCRALRLAVEWFRAHQPTCMGTLYWQINDCWPGVTSWACIDGDGRLKPLWYATRKFFADHLCTIQPDGFEYRPGDPLTLHIINDRDEPATGGIPVRRMSFDGSTIARQEIPAESLPRSVLSLKLNREIITPGDASRELIAVGTPATAFWFFGVDKTLHYPAPSFDAELTRDGNKHRLIIHARSLLRDIILSPDRLDPEATLSDNVITLLPGDAFTFEITSAKSLDRAALISPPVFQCVNRM